MTKNNTKPKSSFIPDYYVQAYALAREGHDGSDIAKRLDPPVRMTQFMAWRRKDPSFSTAIERGTQDREPTVTTIGSNITNPRQMSFLMMYAQSGSIMGSARAAEINMWSHYHWLNAEKEKGVTTYADAFEMAKKVYADSLVAEATRRGRDGLRRYKFHQGRPIVMPCKPNHPEAEEFEDSDGNKFWGYYYYENVYSDSLLTKLLEARHPDFKPESKTEVNVNQSNVLNLQDLLEEAEAARGNIIDADHVEQKVERKLLGDP